MLKSENSRKSQSGFMFIIIMLTVFFVLAQGILFLIHYKVSDLMDSLVNSSISKELFYPVVFLPILQFLSIQLGVYVLLVCWLWLITISCAEIFKLNPKTTYGLSIINWLLTCAAILALNNYYFPDSFFAQLLDQFILLKRTTIILLNLGAILLPAETLIAMTNLIWLRRHKMIGSILLSVGLLAAFTSGFNYLYPRMIARNHSPKPNVIIIGLDSVRPDFISYFGNADVATPNIDAFLQTATTFTQAYTPLARTYPAWVSILTSKYPLHHSARNNLVDPSNVLLNVTLAQRFQAAGYETIYATDEKRFSNITRAYGFDKIIGPKMGANDFLLGSLSDFPLTNLLVNLSIGQYLFPFNYANRAAAITYKPETFNQQLTYALARRENKPLFLIAHLCLTHWPFSWARAGMPKKELLAQQYGDSVAAVDAQFGMILAQLKSQGLLENSLLVLLSDHGTAVGLPGDRFVNQKNYVGDAKKLKLISVERSGTAPANSLDLEHDYTINTAYGQGNDLLSLKQYHVLLAFKFAGKNYPARWVNSDVSLVDIAPTILQLLNMSALPQADGISLANNFFNKTKSTQSHTGLFMETGDSMSEIETDHIFIERVVKHEIGMYRINPKNGFLFVDQLAEVAIIKNKQLGILYNGWLLVRYPARMQTVLDKKTVFKDIYVPPYYVLANMNTGEWTIGFDSKLAQTAPVQVLLAKLKKFYGGEL